MPDTDRYDLIVIGGGAAGFYGAIHVARRAKGARILILEKSRQCLSKVLISGGGRCNVTHRPLEPAALSANYPRGQKALIGPFHRHASSEVIHFFEELGVRLKTEDDGRVFPVSDSSEEIAGALEKEAGKLGIEVRTSAGVTDLAMHEHDPQDPKAQSTYEVFTKTTSFRSRTLLLACGSSPTIWRVMGKFGYRIVSPVPSLFTFNIDDARLDGLQGISVPAQVELLPPEFPKPAKPSLHLRSLKRSGSLIETGPLLITHWGISGPPVLRLSAWAARYLSELGYRFQVRINWIPDYHPGSVPQLLEEVRLSDPAKSLSRTRPIELPQRLWQALVEGAGISLNKRWGELSKAAIRELANQLTAATFEVRGKSTFKEEFVTAGGLDLRDFNGKTFESKKHPGLYAAGEVLNIDAITGGFNFQGAWTGAYIAAESLSEALTT
ncbi:hypothetical protein SAMN04490243_1456 [Robiginitalea myxolifaciens]|uniref:Flavoprotein, HI0933 family n=1 Tax=Robiginitalea myxolifaciens TaxID=400055 RepID=A0A1I6G9V0_9FLAO|nr:NAD(P)/FAD-dependent oxidoreductase [Robiginitalea myxolifaciens]SFR38930.1 hypothetical protein SAMN04490243_1456 [Robiginitalea myxolifaciens]